MQYKIYIESRMDKQKPVIDAIKELTSDFTIFTGTAYFNGNHRPCQVIEIYVGEIGLEIALIERCTDKLKKILNMPHILVVEVGSVQVLY